MKPLHHKSINTMTGVFATREDAENAYRTLRIRDGEILIDFGLHTPNEKKLILGLWQDYGGFPLVRRVGDAA